MLPENLKTGWMINPVERVRVCAIMWKLNIRLASSAECDGFGDRWIASSSASATWLAHAASDQMAHSDSRIWRDEVSRRSYSLLGTARLNGHEPYAWLKDALGNLLVSCQPRVRTAAARPLNVFTFMDILDSLRQAPSAELYRLYLAIGKMLDGPRRILEVRQRLHLGMAVSYVADDPLGPLSQGTLVRLNAKTASIAVTDSEGHWRVSYSLLRHIVDL
jgi:hypothetical protein